jgi:predicted methyltransferase MtxX (methanogen marker protein 4)
MIKNNTGTQATSTVKAVTQNKAVNTKKSPTIKNTDAHVKIIDAKE